MSYTINVDGQGLYVEKFTITDMNLGNQPELFEFVIPPNSTVKIQEHNLITMELFLVF